MKKVYVYAICKNEEKHIKRWVESMKEADSIYVLDTGSTDNSVNLLKELGVNVTVKNYEHFKFDEARNDSLNLVPDEDSICVCTDIDEVFDKGWRKILDSIWEEDTKRLRYNMNFSFDEEGNPVSTYYISKIHTRKDYVWKHSIHEVIAYIGKEPEKVITTDLFNINHHPDREKKRDFYLDLLEEEVKKYPEDDRNMHYLGREYMYKGRWNDAIDSLIKHLNLKSSTWDEERGASMRYISRCYKALNRYDEAEIWLTKAIEETPSVREPYVEMGMLYYEKKDYFKSIEYLLKAKIIKDRSPKYINEEFAWNETICDLLSLDFYYLGAKEEAIFYAKEALKINDKNERIKNNLVFYEKMDK